MTNSVKIRKDLGRRLPDVLRQLIEGEDPFPLPLALRDPAPDMDHAQAMAHLEDLRSLELLGGVLCWETRTTRRLGAQTWPVCLFVPDLASLSRLLGQRDLTRFPRLARAVLSRIPALEDWWCNQPLKAWELRGRWSGLVHALRWFRENPSSGLHPREIPWRLHGKYVEENRALLGLLLARSERTETSVGLPTDSVRKDRRLEERLGLRADATLVRVRIGTSDRLRSGLPSEDLAMPLESWERLSWRPETILVVENLATFLAAPLDRFGACVWGQGFAATRLASWLGGIPEVLYWGDLDAQGFEILDRLRALCPHVLSLGMDARTFDRFRFLSCPGTASPVKELERLTQEEWALYRQLAEGNLRLEQEKIPIRGLQNHPR